MEETPREEVLRHHGFKEIALKFRKKWLDDDAVDCIKWVIMRISDDIRKFGYQYAKDLEYGANKQRIMCGIKGKITYTFLGPAHE